MTRVIIVDDHPIVRRGLKQIVIENYDTYDVDEASSGLELLQKARANKYDIILLDISMPDMNGLEAIDELKKQKYDTPILMLSIHPEEQYAIRALKAGASGYLNKEASPNELLLAIQALLVGKKYVSQELSDRLIEYLGIDTKRPHELLTNREYQIMLLIASGNKLNDIANELKLSVKTISTHKTNTFNKLGLSSNAELVRYALDNKLLD